MQRGLCVGHHDAVEDLLLGTDESAVYFMWFWPTYQKQNQCEFTTVSYVHRLNKQSTNCRQILSTCLFFSVLLCASFAHLLWNKHLKNVNTLPPMQIQHMEFTGGDLFFFFFNCLVFLSSGVLLLLTHHLHPSVPHFSSIHMPPGILGLCQINWGHPLILLCPSCLF